MENEQTVSVFGQIVLKSRAKSVKPEKEFATGIFERVGLRAHDLSCHLSLSIFFFPRLFESSSVAPRVLMIDHWESGTRGAKSG